MTDSNRPQDPSSNTQRSQSDIGQDTGLGQANARENRAVSPGQPGEPRAPLDSPEEKATQFDGNPNPGTEESGDLFKPRDDTPAILEKKSGPKN